MANFISYMRPHRNSHMTGLATKPMLAIVAVIVIVAIYFFSGSGRDVNKVGMAELNAIRAGDMQTAYDLTSTAFKKQTPPAAFTSYVGQYPILQQYTSVNFSQQQIEKTTAAIGGVMIGPDGRQMQIQFQFVKENKAWRIQGLSLAPLGNAAPKWKLIAPARQSRLSPSAM